MYSQNGTRLGKQFSFGESCMQEGVLLCCVTSEGIVVLTRAFTLWLVADLEAPSPQRMAAPKLASPPACITALAAEQTLSGTTEASTSCGLSHYLLEELWLKCDVNSIHTATVSSLQSLQ